MFVLFFLCITLFIYHFFFYLVISLVIYYLFLQIRFSFIKIQFISLLIYFYTFLFNSFMHESNYLFFSLFIYLYIFWFIFDEFSWDFLSFIFFFMHHFTLLRSLFNYDIFIQSFTDAFHFFSFMCVLIYIYTFLFN